MILIAILWFLFIIYSIKAIVMFLRQQKHIVKTCHSVGFFTSNQALPQRKAPQTCPKLQINIHMICCEYLTTFL